MKKNPIKEKSDGYVKNFYKICKTNLERNKKKKGENSTKRK